MSAAASARPRPPTHEDFPRRGYSKIPHGFFRHHARHCDKVDIILVGFVLEETVSRPREHGESAPEFTEETTEQQLSEIAGVTDRHIRNSLDRLARAEILTVRRARHGLRLGCRPENFHRLPERPQKKIRRKPESEAQTGTGVPVSLDCPIGQQCPVTQLFEIGGRFTNVPPSVPGDREKGAVQSRGLAESTAAGVSSEGASAAVITLDSRSGSENDGLLESTRYAPDRNSSSALHPEVVASGLDLRAWLEDRLHNRIAAPLTDEQLGAIAVALLVSEPATLPFLDSLMRSTERKIRTWQFVVLLAGEARAKFEAERRLHSRACARTTDFMPADPPAVQQYHRAFEVWLADRGFTRGRTGAEVAEQHECFERERPEVTPLAKLIG